ncbi:DUF2089 domain-containing protein [Promineifilum sp.]|uniref:DUF2089 domain-containing protein n=1 Tax=Promineifilum sp. TaxID=2664178 RepID=UPI0035AF30C0
MRKILESCPTCGSEMIVSEVTCTTCDTVVRSRYAPCPFCRLAPEDLAFMLLFVRSRGNVKDMERELGVSYWTIRGRLNEIIAGMGLEEGGQVPGSRFQGEEEDGSVEEGEVEPESEGRRGRRRDARPNPARPAGVRLEATRPDAEARRAILDQLRRGELTAEQAAEQLRG